MTTRLAHYWGGTIFYIAYCSNRYQTVFNLIDMLYSWLWYHILHCDCFYLSCFPPMRWFTLLSISWNTYMYILIKTFNLFLQLLRSDFFGWYFICKLNWAIFVMGLFFFFCNLVLSQIAKEKDFWVHCKDGPGWRPKGPKPLLGPKYFFLKLLNISFL